MISISDGLGPSILCRKMEKARPKREQLFVSRQSRHFPFDGIPLDSTFPYLYHDLACKQILFPPEKGINRTNESTILELSELFRDSSELY